jgi:hypothetical protein
VAGLRGYFLFLNKRRERIREGLRSGTVSLPNENDFYVAQLLRHKGGKRWSFKIGDEWVSVTTSELTNQHTFRHAVADAIGVLPPMRAPINHEFWVRNLMENAAEKENADP